MNGGGSGGGGGGGGGGRVGVAGVEDYNDDTVCWCVFLRCCGVLCCVVNFYCTSSLSPTSVRCLSNVLVNEQVNEDTPELSLSH